MKRATACIVSVFALTSCTRAAVTAPRATNSAAPVSTPAFTPPPAPPRLEAARMFATVRALAALGPREATGDAYRRAGATVERRLRALGYRVVRQPFEAPEGVSWGEYVPAGTSFNVIATPPGVAAHTPRFVVGAHLDTVPQSPGANDNASGIAVMLELARIAAAQAPRRAITFIAFGAEEPRAGGDDGHHFGSRHHVANLRRSTVTGMVSLDRVGIGRRVRICTGSAASHPLRRTFLARADRLGIDAIPCTDRNSDHWSFEKAGIHGVRLLGAPHATYHTPRDRPNVVDRAQLLRIARIAWATLLAAAPRIS